MVPDPATDKRRDGRAERLAALVYEVADMFGIVDLAAAETVQPAYPLTDEDQAAINTGYHLRGLSLGIADERVIWRGCPSTGRHTVYFAYEMSADGGSRASGGLIHLVVRYGCWCDHRPTMIAISPATLADVIAAIVVHERVGHQIDPTTATAWRHGGEVQ